MGRHRRHPPTEPRGRRGPPSGYSLVEVVVAMLLACVIITSVFSVTLTSKTSGGKNDRRALAAQASRQITGRLRNFVTGCDCNVATGVCTAVSCTLKGPTPRAGVASWYLNCPSPGCVPALVDCFTTGDPGASYAAACGGVDTYALRNGYHSIKGLLPAFFENAPYNARVVYAVSTAQTIAGVGTVPQVDVNVKWTEP